MKIRKVVCENYIKNITWKLDCFEVRRCKECYYALICYENQKHYF